MSGEFDPAEELGLFPDRIAVLSLTGFITRNDPLRSACEHFIRNGGHIYDLLKRYDEITSYVLGREEASPGQFVKWVIPLLKGNGVTDYMLKKQCSEDLQLMPGGQEAFGYISRLLPTQAYTSLIQHAWLAAEDLIGPSLCDVSCSTADMDGTQFGRGDNRKIKEICESIAKLKIPKTRYRFNVPVEMDPLDIEMIKTLDSVIQDEFPQLPAMSLMQSTDIMTSHRKAYKLLDWRRQISIDLDSTLCIGGEDTDYQLLSLIKDSKGVAVSFNGSDVAVRGSQIAILSKDATVGAVFASVFYDRGIEAMLDLANNWERKYLKTCEFTDRNLLDRMLEAHPRTLPEVYIVDEDNVDAIAEKSDAYRRRAMGRKV